MKKLLLILLLTTPFIGFGQGCQYGSSTDASELCDFYRGNNFATYRNADIALDKILDVTGMSKRFVLKECNDISNCVATAYKGIRYILYDREFMDDIATRTNSWSSMSILAHEIGHHVNGHSLDLVLYANESAEVPTLSESRQMELEADEYSGFVMYKLGASLSQAQEAIRLISTNDDDSYSTHPARDKRLRAIERGYNKAKGKSSNNDYSTNSSTLTAEDYFYKAYNNESDYQYKIDNYTKCIRLDPNYYPATVYYNRGISYNKLGNHNDAIADYTRALRIDPDYASAYHNRGVAYENLKKWEGAIADFTRAIKIDPDYALAYQGRGYSYDELGNYNDAIADYTRAIRIEPDNADSYRNRGIAYNKLENYEDAIADYTRAIRIDPNYANAYKSRGIAKENAGLPYCSDYKKACDLGNEDGCKWYNEQCQGTNNSSALTAKDYFDKAYNNESDYQYQIDNYTKCLRLDPDYDRAAYNNRGLVYYKLGNYEDAIADYTRAIRIDPDYAMAYYNRGLSYSNLGNYENEIADYTRAIRIDPDYASAYKNRGIAKENAGLPCCSDYKRACDLGKEKCCEWYNEQCQGTNNSSTLTAEDYFDKAYNNKLDWQYQIDNYTKCLNLDPNYGKSDGAIAYNNRAIAYDELENYEDAIADYTRAIRIDPDYTEAYRNRGIAYNKLENYEDAIADYTRAIRIDPNYANAYKSRGIAKENAGLPYCSDYKKACDLGNEDGCKWYNEQCQGSNNDYSTNNSALIAEDYFDKAYNNESDYQYQIDNYTKCLSLDPNYGESDGAITHYNRGLAYGKLGNYEDAIADFTRAIRIDPNYADAYNNRGLAYVKSENYGYAIDDFTRAIRIDPDDAYAYYRRGDAYNKSKNYKDAIADYTRAIRIEPDNADSYKDRGITKENAGLPYCSDYKKACDLGDEDCCDWYNEQCQGSNNDYSTNNSTLTAEDYFDKAYNNESDYQYQIDNYTKCLSLDPNYGKSDGAITHYNRGLAYGKLGNYEDAIADYTRAIRIDPDYADAYFNRGLAYGKLGNYEDAIADYTRALRIDPDDVDGYINRGIAKENAGLPYCSDYKRACDLGDEDGCEWYKQCR